MPHSGNRKGWKLSLIHISLAAAAAAVGVILWRRKKQAARTEAPRDWGWDDGGDGEE